MKKYEHQQAEIRRHKENFIGLPVEGKTSSALVPLVQWAPTVYKESERERERERERNTWTHKVSLWMH